MRKTEIYAAGKKALRILFELPVNVLFAEQDAHELFS